MDELSIRLSIDRLKLDEFHIEISIHEDMRTEKVRSLIPFEKVLSLDTREYWWELIEIPDENHLDTSEWGTSHPFSVDPDGDVDEVENISSDHRYLIDDDDIDLGEEFTMLLRGLHFFGSDMGLPPEK